MAVVGPHGLRSMLHLWHTMQVQLSLYRGTPLLRKRIPLGRYRRPVHPPRALPLSYAQGPMGVLGGWAISHGRGNPGTKPLRKPD